MMRPPAKRASNFMALLFTVLVWLPLLGFVGFVAIQLRPDLRHLTALSSLSFAASLAACLLLYVSYWLSLPGVSFYQTIYYLCMLLPVTGLAGSYSLAYIASVREKDSRDKGTGKEKDN